MTPSGWRRAPGRLAAAANGSRRARPQSAPAVAVGGARRGLGVRVWAMPLLLAWLWSVACSAPAPTGSAPAAPASPAKPAAAPASSGAAPSTSGALSGTGGSASAAPSAQAARPTVAPLSPPVPVKVGVTGIAPEAAIYQALEQGYFQDEGLDVELVSVRGITEQVGLLATGQLAFGNGGIDPGVFNAAQRDIGLKLVTAMVLSTEQNPGGAALLVRTDLVDSGQYKGLPDLR